MPDILILIFAILLIILGLAGCILPIIPGPPVSFVGLFLLKYTRFVEAGNMDAFETNLWYFAGAAVLVTVLDYIVPVWGTKKFGGSKAGTWGAGIGLVIGLFFAPIGLIVGPFLGAFIGEMINGRDEQSSLKAAFGSFIGFLTGVILKFIVSGYITVIFIKEIFTA
ncbi:MAG: DUF456 domain-containing protein [Bacteroidales bacterium]|nr:DUF456 domain-containing protein [Bacteroidales bacterium]